MAVESFREGESILAVPSPLVNPVNEPYLILPSESNHSQARGHVRKPCARKPCGHMGAGWPTAPQWAEGGLAQGGWRCGQCDLVELAGWPLGRRDSCLSWLRGPTGLQKLGRQWACYGHTAGLCFPGCRSLAAPRLLLCCSDLLCGFGCTPPRALGLAAANLAPRALRRFPRPPCHWFL